MTVSRFFFYSFFFAFFAAFSVWNYPHKMSRSIASTGTDYVHHYQYDASYKL